MAKAKNHPTPRATTERDQYVGKMIRQHRLVAGLSQSDLGEHLGVSFQQIQKYEKGINRIAVTRLEQLAKALMCRTADLLPLEGDQLVHGEASALRDLMATSEGIRLSQAFASLPKKLRAPAVQLLELMADPR